jgi:hypothetical protein
MRYDKIKLLVLTDETGKVRLYTQDKYFAKMDAFVRARDKRRVEIEFLDFKDITDDETLLRAYDNLMSVDSISEYCHPKSVENRKLAFLALWWEAHYKE